MKKTLLAAVAVVGLAITAPMVLMSDASAHDPKHDKKKDKYKIELAGDICVAMANSGAYTTMDADTLSAFCLQVATNVVDSTDE